MNIVKSEIVEGGARYTMGLTENTCSQAMEVLSKDGVVLKVRIHGGCQGNLTGISRLVEGCRIDEVVSRLKGIDCGGKGTSCPDQLAQLLERIED